MKLTIDNYDGKGAVDYTSSLVAGRPFRIVRRLNQPAACELTLLPAPGLATPARNGRITVADDQGVLLFTGYVATEPALELAGQGLAGAVYQLFVSALGDEALLDRQPMPPTGPIVGATAGSALQAMLQRSQVQGITAALSLATMGVSEFQAQSNRTWSQNVAALAAASRNAYLLQNNTLSLSPVGTVTHTLSEAAGTLSLSSLQIATAQALANDVTVCGEAEPAAFVTEFFQGDGTTLLFELTQPPWKPPVSKSRTFTENFQGSVLNPQLWILADPSSAVQLTANGLSCAGGNGSLGTTVVSAFSTVEMGGALILEAGSVQFGAQTSGILNGLYTGGETTLSACMAGFQIGQSGGAATVAPILNGAVCGSTFAAVAGHLYTLRLRFYANEVQRILQAYYVPGAESGYSRLGGDLLPTGATVVFEVQDVTNGVAGTPTLLYAGSFGSTAPAPWCVFAPLNAALLQCSIGNVTVQQLGPDWVVTTPLNGSPVIARLGTPAQGANCTVESTGRLRFYPDSTPAAGTLIAIAYRTSRRSVARLASATSIAAESRNGQLPGTAAWIGTVTNPAPRSSADCENAAQAILSLATSRAAAWAGKYVAWNPELPGAPGSAGSDIWPGDVLALASTSAGITANLVVRSVQIDLSATAPTLAQYTIGFANEWADALSIETSSSVPADVWLPLQPETAAPLANLDGLTVTALTGSQIQISAGVTPPTGGGFEVRRRDYSFTPGPGPDLVLRSPVPAFTIPREAAVERYYIRMYDASTPPNYSRFSSAVFVNVPLSS